MLILTGPMKNSLNRVPVVTFALMGVIAVLLLVQLVTEGKRGRVVQHACEMYAAHGYLKADLRLQLMIEASPGLRFLRNRTAKSSGGPLEALQQQQLDELWQRAERAMSGRTYVVLGIMPAQPTLWGYLTFPLVHHQSFQVILILIMMYMTAPYLEDRWGRWFLPVLFYAGSLAGLGTFWVFHPSSYTAFHGAECGVTAILAAYLVRFPREQLRYVYLIQILKRETTSTVWVLLLLWFVFQCSTAYFWKDLTQNPYPGFLPLLASFGVGAVISLSIKTLGLEKFLYQTEFEKLSEADQFDVLIGQHRGLGAAEELLATLERAYSKYPDREDYLREYWTQSVRMDRHGDITAVGKRVVERDLELADFESAYYHWREVTEGQKGQNIALNRAQHLAEGLIAIGHHLQAREVMAYTIDHFPVDLGGNELFDLLETAQAADPRLALSAIDRLLLENRCSVTDAPRLKDLRAELLAFHPEILRPAPERLELEVSIDFPVNHGEPFSPTRIDKLKIYRGVIQAFHDNAFDFSLEGQEQLKRLPFNQIKAIWAAAIRPFSEAPELLLDLHLDDPLVERPSHRVLRLLGRELDPLRFSPTSPNKAQAVRDMVRRMIDTGQGAAMPSREALLNQRFPIHVTIADFESSAYGTVST